MQSKERGGCLTAWLIVVVILNALVAFYYLSSSSGLREVYPTVSPALFILLAIIGAINVVSAISLWTWHKWGFYLFTLTSVLTFVINLAIGLSLISSLIGFVGVAILWFLLRNRWQAFE